MRIKTLFYTVILFLLLSLFKVFSMGGVSLFAQPSHLWATYYGGTSWEFGSSVVTDAAGNAYLAGTTVSDSGIASGGFQNIYGGGLDAFLVKFDASGTRLWATYYGGTSNEFGYGVATDVAGNIYLAGQTDSGPTGIASGGFQNIYGGGLDAFLVKFDAGGTRLWATYYGGTGTEGGGLGGGISVATDAASNVYLAGVTTSDYGIASGGFQNIYGGYGSIGGFAGGDAFLVKFNENGTRLWATYYGGTGMDRGNNVVIDASGNVYLAGSTDSPAGISSGGFQNTFGGGGWFGYGDAFLVKFGGSGNRLWATYYGGVDYDWGYSVVTDAANNVYLSGVTGSANAIASGGFQNTYGGGGGPAFGDAFLVKFNGSGIRLWGTYYGGNTNEWSMGTAVDGNNNIYLLMEVEDAAAPSLVDTCAYQSVFNGGSSTNPSGGFPEDQLIVKFSPAGNKLCATYVGGVGEDDIDYGNGGGIAIHGNSLYVTGMTDGGYPVTAGAFQTTYAGPFTALQGYGGTGGDAFLSSLCANICEGKALGLSFTSNATNVCTNDTVTFAPSVANTCDTTGYQFYWIFTGGNPASSDSINPTVTYSVAGTYTVTLVLTTFCKKDSVTKTIMINPSLSAIISSTQTQCTFNNGTATINAINGTSPYTYSWSNGQTVQTATGLALGNYTVTVIDANGCTATQTIMIASSGSITTTSQSVSICSGSTYTLPEGTVVSTGGMYNDTLTSASGCDSIITTNLTVNPNPTAAVLSNTTITQGQSVTLTASGGGTYSWNNGSTENTMTITPPVTSIYCVTVMDAKGCTDTACVTITIEPIDCFNSGELYIPNAFSPNGDGENDVLKIYYGNIKCIKTLQLIIYDRWGEKVFQTKNSVAEWDGVYKGKRQNTAVFVYYLEAMLVSGEGIIKKGNVNLIK